MTIPFEKKGKEDMPDCKHGCTSRPQHEDEIKNVRKIPGPPPENWFIYNHDKNIKLKIGWIRNLRNTWVIRNARDLKETRHWCEHVNTGYRIIKIIQCTLKLGQKISKKEKITK